ncbi:transcriptional repressor general negative regulator of transcription subunit 4 [Irineochytrium annulatum]|nr:transcriptional repressor general negative regulator of transcription subunit 4 [Irineochytrium annulatum]
MSSPPGNGGFLSDDEDLECPLCMEEIDITDKYFKPCPCGYQICRFCWNHIKEDLNGLCPACRRQYTEDTVEFKPVSAEEYASIFEMFMARLLDMGVSRMARIKNAKKKREKEKKEMDNAARRHLANVRVVQKNLIYVLGMPAKYCTEEILRGQDFFGQFGKISRVIVNRRGHGHTPVISTMSPAGVYVTYNRKEEAIKAIEAVDGTIYDGRVIRATHGTTKYCSYFLKNQPCQNPNCGYLHEPAEEADTYAKEELGRQLLRDRQPRPVPFPVMIANMKREEKEESALPPTANWAKPGAKPATAVSAGTPAPPPVPLEPEPEHVPPAEEIEKAEKKVERNERKKTKKPAPTTAATTASTSAVPATATNSSQPPGLTNRASASSFTSVTPATKAPVVEERVLGSLALNEDGTDEVIVPMSAKSRVSPNPNPKATTNEALAALAKAAAAAVAAAATSAAIFGGVSDDVNITLSGFSLHPTYVGPFNPFGNDAMAAYLASGEGHSPFPPLPSQAKPAGMGLPGNVEGILSSMGGVHGLPGGGRFDPYGEGRSPRRGPNIEDVPTVARNSRLARFFGNAHGDSDSYDGEMEKMVEERKSNPTFRSLFPNVNASFGGVGLSDAEARWGEGFSPSKVATHADAGTAASQWVHQQQREHLESSLRQHVQQQQAQQAHQQAQQAQQAQAQQQAQFNSFSGFRSSGAGGAGGVGGAGAAAMAAQFSRQQDLRQQQELFQQQQLLLQQQQQQQQQGVQPQALYNRLQQQALHQQQQQAQQQAAVAQAAQQHQQFGLHGHHPGAGAGAGGAGGGAGAGGGHGQNDEFLGAFMREAQIRESQLQLRELQIRERAALASQAGGRVDYRDGAAAAMMGVGKIGSGGGEGGLDRSAVAAAARARAFDLGQQGGMGGDGWGLGGGMGSMGYGAGPEANSILRDRADAIAALREREAQREMDQQQAQQQQHQASALAQQQQQQQAAAAAAQHQQHQAQQQQAAQLHQAQLQHPLLAAHLQREMARERDREREREAAVAQAREQREWELMAQMQAMRQQQQAAQQQQQQLQGGGGGAGAGSVPGLGSQGSPGARPLFQGRRRAI